MLSSRIILLTAFRGSSNILKQTIKSIIKQLNNDDMWIIVLDNQNTYQYNFLKKKYNQLIFIKNSGLKGAGNSRNLGLDYILKKISGRFLLFPIDGDDKLTNNAIRIIKKRMKNSEFNIVTFAHRKIWPNGSSRIISYNGVCNIKDLLYNFNTVLGATIVKIDNPKILKLFRFGSRFRANDLLFFYQTVDYFGKFKFYSDIVLNSYKGNSNTLSGKKHKMPYYRYLALRDFGMSIINSVFYTLIYIFQGIRKYLFKHSI